jgi:cyclohexa-1,5-dienecarbonyl-CoA hydratase
MKEINFEIKPPHSFITINRPPNNVMNISAMNEISDAIEQVSHRDDVITTVFSGSGEKAFSTGVDIKEHTPALAGEMIKSFHRIFRKLLLCEQVTIAVVKGYCLGGGFELAGFCDMVIATNDAVFGQPEINVACFPPIALAFYPYIVGPKRALEIALMGKNITAEQAKSLGMVNEISTREELNKTLERYLVGLSEKSSSAIKLTKKAYIATKKAEIAKAIDVVEDVYVNELVKTHDCAEGINAFLEKRKPVWRKGSKNH